MGWGTKPLSLSRAASARSWHIFAWVYQPAPLARSWAALPDPWRLPYHKDDRHCCLQQHDLDDQSPKLSSTHHEPNSSPLEGRPKSRHGYGPPPRDGVVKRAEEIRTVARAEWLWPRCRLSGRAKVVHQIARRQGHPDRAFGKAFPVGSDDVGSQFDAPAGERNVRRNDDCFRVGPFGDPVVCSVGAGADDNPLDSRRTGDEDRAVRDNKDSQPVATGDFDRSRPSLDRRQRRRGFAN